MVVFPNCKINIGLRIGSKRPDGFHNLSTIFIPIPLTDALEIIPAASATGKQVIYSQSGITIDGNEADNLCIKAYNLLKQDFPMLPAVRLHLHKNIPMGAGLGGGSADASFTLQLLNNQFQLNLSTSQLIDYSLQLGSDCPFFIINKPCFATGRGEILEELVLDLSAFKIMLVNPGIHINTGWAFKQLQISGTHSAGDHLTALINEPIETWKINLTNDFELPVFELHPEIKKIKEVLYSNGAKYAAMSGSGSTIFGIFKKDSIPTIKFPENYFLKTLQLQ